MITFVNKRTNSRLMRAIKAYPRQIDWSKYHPQNWDWRKIIWPFRVMVHPLDGFEEIKYEGRGSLALANIIYLLYFFSGIFSILETSFIHNYSQPEKLNVLLEFAKSVLPWILWSISNWSFCTLMDGEGWLKEIWIGTSYALMPVVVSLMPLTLISKVLAFEDYSFITIANAIFRGWSYILIVLSVMVIQQYTLKKTLKSIVLTIVGVLAILLLAVLFFSLFQQVFIFLSTVYNELLFRL